MNKRIEKYIPEAIKAAEKYLANKGKIKSEYNGYISSFGAAVMQSGLKAAVAFNENTNANSAQDKYPLLQAILYVIRNGEVNSGDKLLTYILGNSEREDYIKNEIMDAAAALKLAIRTFELTKGE